MPDHAVPVKGRAATPDNPYRGLEATSRAALEDLFRTGVTWIDDDGDRRTVARVHTLRDTLARRVPFPLSVTKYQAEDDGQLGFVIFVG